MTEHRSDAGGDVPPPAAARHGGLVHSYQRYDPKNFPPPTAPGSGDDLASAALEHMLMYGSTRELTEEELARAIRLDPSMFPRLGPSLDSLIAMLEERKRRILERHTLEEARREAARTASETAASVRPPDKHARDFAKAAREESIADLERLYYRQRDDASAFARDLVRLMERLGEKYQVEDAAARYAFTGSERVDVARAIELKEELETIDRLLEQLREAKDTAQLAIIDLEELSEFAESGDIENINELQRQVEEFVRREAERQGLEKSREGFKLTPHAYRLFQSRLLSELFSSLKASRPGRHDDARLLGEGSLESTLTRPYEFGDSVSHIDAPQSFVNAMLRRAAEDPAGDPLPLTLDPRDIEIHRTRNAPRAATCLLLDMSGSMRYGGQYVNVKRMALALDALIRAEYPGDHLSAIEMFTFARLLRPGEIAAAMPKPVSIHSPVVRLKVDTSDERFSESRVPQHFTNIQRAMRLARRLLSGQPTPNRNIILITDGLPTAHDEAETLYLLYPPDPRTEEATMREAVACGKEGITITIVLLPSWSQTEDDVKFATRMAQAARGKVLFAAGKDLSRFVLWDYMNRRRAIIG